LVASARAHARRWRNADVAVRDGYRSDGQRGVVHMVDTRHLVAGDGRLDPAHPSALVYVEVAGRLRLAGVMFLEADTANAGPRIGGPLTPWHAHVDCRGPRGVSIPPPGAGCPAGDETEQSPEMLHVWLPGVVDPFGAEMSPYGLACALHRAGTI
jgi:hypothetical protein